MKHKKAFRLSIVLTAILVSMFLVNAQTSSYSKQISAKTMNIEIDEIDLDMKFNLNRYGPLTTLQRSPSSRAMPVFLLPPSNKESKSLPLITNGKNTVDILKRCTEFYSGSFFCTSLDLPSSPGCSYELAFPSINQGRYDLFDTYSYCLNWVGDICGQAYVLAFNFNPGC